MQYLTLLLLAAVPISNYGFLWLFFTPVEILIKKVAAKTEVKLGYEPYYAKGNFTAVDKEHDY